MFGRIGTALALVDEVVSGDGCGWGELVGFSELGEFCVGEVEFVAEE